MVDIGRLDRYWRLDHVNDNIHQLRNKLERAGYSRLPTGRTELVSLINRIDRSLPCYTLCTNEELSRFLKGRQIPLPVLPRKGRTIKAIRKARIAALLSADDDVKFERFSDLPPELRTNIFEYYMADYPTYLKTPTKPPIARANKQLRSEALPVFYSHHEFQLSFEQTHKSPNVNAGSNTFKADADTTCFLMSLAPEDIGYVRKLQLGFYCVYKRGNDTPTTYSQCLLHVNMPVKDTDVMTFTVAWIKGIGQNPTDPTQKLQELFNESPETSAPGKKLSFLGLQAIRKAVESLAKAE